MKDMLFKELMQYEIGHNRCFEIKMANNQSIFTNRSIFIRTVDDNLIQLSTLMKIEGKILESIYQMKNCQVKATNLALTNIELLNLTKLAFNKQVEDLAFRGVCFSKSGIHYKFLEYSSEDRTGILFRELDGKILLILGFPKYGRVLWEVKGQYGSDTVGISKCKEAYKLLHTSKRKINYNQLDQ